MFGVGAQRGGTCRFLFGGGARLCLFRGAALGLLARPCLLGHLRFGLQALCGSLRQCALGFGALLRGSCSRGVSLCLLVRDAMKLGFLVDTLGGTLDGHQVRLGAQIVLFDLVQQVRNHRFRLIPARGGLFQFGFRGLARIRRARGLEFGFSALLGRLLCRGLGCGACLHLLERTLLGLGALLGEARSLLFRGLARLGSALEGFFGQLLFACGAYGVKFGLIALARDAQRAFFLRGRALQAFYFLAILCRGRLALREADLGVRGGCEIQVNQIAQLIGIGVANRAHLRQHLSECLDDLRVELGAGCAFNQGCRAIHG